MITTQPLMLMEVSGLTKAYSCGFATLAGVWLPPGNTVRTKVNALAISSVVGVTAFPLPLAAQQMTKIDFANETVGAEPKALVPVVGIWRIKSESGNTVIAVDGRQWKEGQSSGHRR